MPTATLTTATLETVGRPKPSKYEGKPDYRPCLFKMGDGSQKWKSYSEGAPELSWLKKGATYQAAIAADGEFTLIQPSDTAPAAAPAVATQQPADAMAAAKRAIAADVSTMADLYGFCYGEAKRVLEPQGATTEGIQGCAFRLWHHAKDRL